MVYLFHKFHFIKNAPQRFQLSIENCISKTLWPPRCGGDKKFNVWNTIPYNNYNNTSLMYRLPKVLGYRGAGGLMLGLSE